MKGCHENHGISSRNDWVESQSTSGLSLQHSRPIPTLQKENWHTWGMWAAGGMGLTQCEQQLSSSGSNQDMREKII